MIQIRVIIYYNFLTRQDSSIAVILSTMQSRILNPTELTQTIYLNQNRRKIWGWAEVLGLTGSTPTGINFLLHQTIAKQPIPDPFWYYTQSAKNYTHWSDNQVFSKYTQPDLWTSVSHPLGLHTGISALGTHPLWATYVTDSDWYWQQRALSRLCDYLYQIPGVREIYLSGSVQLEVSSSVSDMDIIIRCYPGWVLPVRLFTKLLLKISGSDVHLFTAEVGRFLTQILSFTGLSWVDFGLSFFQNKLWSYKSRPGIKVDAGIFFEEFQQLEKYYTSEPRQVGWLWQSLYVARPNFWSQPDSSLRRSLVLPPQVRRARSRLLLRCLLVFFLLPAIPLSLTQLFLYRIKNPENLNFQIGWRFIGFVPRIYKDGYWKSY